MNFLSHSAEKFRRRESFGVSLFSGVESFGLEKAGGESKFSVEKLLSHSDENFCRRTLLCCFSESFRQRKSLWIRERGDQDFPSEKFCLKVPRNFAGNPSVLCFINFR